MRSIRLFFARTPGVGFAIVALACALMTLEIQRMPVARFVSFSMFAPVPYIVEVLAMLAMVAWYRARPESRASDRRGARAAVAVLAVASTWLLLYAVTADDGLSLAVLMLYRVGTGLLLVLWCERLLALGARRAAWCFALACLLSGALTLGLSAFSGDVARLLLGALPAVAGLFFVTYRPCAVQPSESEDAALDQPLPRFASFSSKDRAVAWGLIMLPLLCRGPLLALQSSWMGLQGEAVMAPLIQIAIGCGIVLAGFIVLAVIGYAWNRSFVLVYELFVLPVTFVSFCTAQAPADLWFLHMLIIDSTYKVILFYIAMTPFLLHDPVRGGNASVPLLVSFAFMIAVRALFAVLHALLPVAAYAGLTVVVVLTTFAGGGILSLLILQRLLARREDAEADAVTTARANLEQRCAHVADRFDLTPREREVLVLLAQNYRAPYIAEKLVVSQSTVKTHMRNLYGKLGVHSQAELLLRLDEEAASISTVS